LIIVAGILLVVLKANPTNSIVSEVHNWAHSLRVHTLVHTPRLLRRRGFAPGQRKTPL
jgi:hypothetical protein